MAVYYVSTTGSDTANGLTLGGAFRTLERAQTAMRASGGEDTALVRGGRYELATALQLTASDNGSSFMAYGGERPVLSGGKAVSNWTEQADGTWTAQLAATDIQQFTVNGARQTEARHPDADPADPLKGGWLFAESPPAGADPFRQMAYDPSGFAAGELGPGMKVRVFTDLSWWSHVLTVQSVDTARNLITFSTPASFELGASSRYFVSDAKVHLDQPGEWFYDTAANILHYKPEEGFTGAGAVASGNNSIIEVTGASNIAIKGFTFADAATASPDVDIYTAGVKVSNSNAIRIEGNRFENLAKGIYVDGGSQGVTIAGNDFEHLWASAIHFDYGASGNTVSGNSIRSVGEVFVALGAIHLSESQGNTISGNLIRDVPRWGIGVWNYDPANPSGGNTIQYNTILHSSRETSDSGAIYVYSSSDAAHAGEIIRYNTIVDAGGLETVPGGFRPGPEYSNGIYLDDFTNKAEVYGNMVRGSVRGGIYFHGGSDNRAWNNIVLENRDIGVQFFDIGDTPMLRNAVFRNIVEAAEPGGNTVAVNVNPVAGSSFRDNFYLLPTGRALQMEQGYEAKSFAEWQALGYDQGSDVLAGNLFRNPAAGDFSLVPGALPLLQGFTDLPWSTMGAFRGGRIVTGTPGADTLSGAAGNDVVDGLDGADRLYGNAGNDDLEGGAGNDIWLTGGIGFDRIMGGPGNDRIDGGADNDMLQGGDGSDFVTGGPGYDRIHGGTGNETFLGGDAGIDYIYGGPGNDRIDGGADGDSLYGDDGIDTITGGLGTDYLYGGAGADYLEGGAANDKMTGGAGADTFDFNPGTGYDSIAGFTDNADTVRIDPGFGFANVAAVLARTIQSGGHARILLNAAGTDSIYLMNYLSPGSGHSIASLADDIYLG